MPRYLIIIILILGIFFRIINLDQKPYWEDETYTLFRSFGFTTTEVSQQLFTGQVISLNDLLSYQKPWANRGIIDTIRSLATQVPEHPPLYFLLTKIWAMIFGSSKFSIRSLPMISSLLTFPALYWLSLELFASTTVGWLTIAFFAVSPICVRYAQEARPYSLWLTIVVLSCAALLRAIRQPNKLNWGIYTLTAILGLYVHLLTSLSLIAQGIYIFIIQRFRLNKILLAYVLSLVISLVIFLPWILVVWNHRESAIATTQWLRNSLPLSFLVQNWTTISLYNLFFRGVIQSDLIVNCVTIAVLLLIIYSGYFLYRHASQKAWLFLYIFVVTVFLPFIIYDLIIGGRTSVILRYFLPFYIGIYLAIAYLLGTKITPQLTSTFPTKLWKLITILIITGEIWSCAWGTMAHTWWDASEFDLKASAVINQVSHPLVISDERLGLIMPLAHQLKSDTNLILLQEPNSLKIPEHFNQIFLPNPSDRLLSVVKQKYGVPEIIDKNEFKGWDSLYLYQLKSRY